MIILLLFSVSRIGKKKKLKEEIKILETLNFHVNISIILCKYNINKNVRHC